LHCKSIPTTNCESRLTFHCSITSNDDKQVIEDLQNNITAALGKITGQIEGLQISLQSVTPLHDVMHEITVPNESEIAIYELGQCLKVSQSVVDAAPSEAKFSVGELCLFDEKHSLRALPAPKSTERTC
jgi:hypothetical protein